MRGRAEPVADDKQVVAAGLAVHLRKVPSDAKYYAVALDAQGNPNAEDIENAAQSVVMIRVALS